MNIDQNQFYNFIKENLRLDKDIDAKKAIFGQTKNWDSLQHMELILSIEKKYNVKFSGEEISKLRTSKIIFEKLKKK